MDKVAPSSNQPSRIKDTNDASVDQHSAADLAWFPPELLFAVFGNLSINDLAQCTRVCRAWSNVCAPHLWRKLTIVTPKAFRRFQSREAQAALVRNAHLVRYLYTVYFPVVESIIRRKQPVSSSSSSSSSCGNPSSTPSSSSSSTRATTSGSTAKNCTQASTSENFESLCTGLVLLDLGALWRVPFPPSATRELAYQAYKSPLPSPPLRCEQEHLIFQLILSNPMLKFISIGGYIQHCDLILKAITDTNLPHLRNVSLFGDHGGMSPWRDHNAEASPSFVASKQFLENCPRSLRNLSARLNAFEPKDASLLKIKDYNPEPCLPHPNLEFVRIYAPFIEPEEWTVPNALQEKLFLKFFKSCGSNIKDVQTPQEEHIKIESLRQVLASHGLSTGKVLRLEGMETITDHEMALELARESDWTKIDFSTCDVVPPGRSTAAALLERCASLEDLDVSTCEGVITSQDLAEILARTPKLVKLIASLDHMSAHGWPRNPQLDAQDFIWTPWVCKSLVYLEVQLINIPRPDVNTGHDGRPLGDKPRRGTIEWSHQIQGLVYHRLAELKDLIHLKLGHCPLEPQPGDPLMLDSEGRLRPVDTEFQLNCLEMSLASGLGLLAGLTQMKVLDLTRMAHRVGVPELEWMQKHWVQLERVSGLFDDWYPALEPGVRDWIVDNDPAWAWEYREMLFNDEGTCGGTLLGEFGSDMD
ncbi:hypothetical protein BG004_004206, partial [Podila humilis]